MRELPTGGDQGHPDPRLARALALAARSADAATPTGAARSADAAKPTGAAKPKGAVEPTGALRAEVLAALVQARVFAAVTATATGHEVAPATGLVAESSAELAVLLVQAPDGSRALPVFSGLAELAAWCPDVRPVVLTGAQACAAAVDEQAQAVLLDPASTAVVLTRPELEALAAGRVPVPGSSLSTRLAEVVLTAPVDPPPAGIVDALRSALAEQDLAAARLLDGPDGLVLGVAAAQPLSGEQLAALAARVVRALGAALPSGGIDLTQVAAAGPGLDLLGRDRLGGTRRRFTRRGR